MPVNLPSNWSLVKLGDVGKIIGGGTPSTKVKEYFDGNIAWITPADLTGYKNKFITIGRRNITAEGLNNSSARIIPKGSILFSSRAPIGYVVIAANDLSTNQGFKSLVPSKKTLSEFVYYYLKSSKQLAEKHASGTTFKEISAKNFAILPIPLPSLPVQQKIVSKIEELFSELDSGVVSLKKAKEQIKTYRQAVLASAFSGRLCRNLIHQIPLGEQKNFINPPAGRAGEIPTNELTQDHLDPIQVRRQNNMEERLNAIQEVTSINKAAEPQTQYRLNYDSSDLRINRIKTKNESAKSDNPVNQGSDNYTSNLPEGWRWMKLGEIIFPSKERFEPLKNVNKKYIGLEHIEKETGKIIGYADSNTVRSTKSVFGKGDLLYGKLRPYLNKVAIAEFSGVCSTDILVFEKQRELSNSFLKYRLLCEDFVSYAKNNMSGVQHPRINIKSISEFEISLPAYTQQLQIVAEIEKRFSEADNLEKAIDNSLAKAETLRQSILKQAFEGRLV